LKKYIRENLREAEGEYLYDTLTIEDWNAGELHCEVTDESIDE
jgi:hypothetical protein